MEEFQENYSVIFGLILQQKNHLLDMLQTEYTHAHGLHLTWNNYITNTEDDPTGEDKHLKPIESDEEWALIENILSSIQEKVDTEEANEDTSK